MLFKTFILLQVSYFLTLNFSIEQEFRKNGNHIYIYRRSILFGCFLKVHYRKSAVVQFRFTHIVNCNQYQYCFSNFVSSAVQCQLPTCRSHKFYNLLSKFFFRYVKCFIIVMLLFVIFVKPLKKVYFSQSFRVLSKNILQIKQMCVLNMIEYSM